MRKIWDSIGIAIFCAAWPFWMIYFRLFPVRSRVLVVCGDEVLLVKGWLSTGKWALPGGGTHRSETASASAVRELHEEVGIKTVESALRSLGEHTHNKLLLKHRAVYFSLELTEKPPLKKRPIEISYVSWLKMADIRGKMLDDDAAFALKHYLPLQQESLL